MNVYNFTHKGTGEKKRVVAKALTPALHAAGWLLMDLRWPIAVEHAEAVLIKTNETLTKLERKC